MDNLNESQKFRQKSWLHPMDPENLPELSKKDRKNAKSLNHLMLIWMILFFTSTTSLIEPLNVALEKFQFIHIGLSALTLITGLFVVKAFMRFVKEVKDELIKKIYLSALATGFVLAFIVGLFFSVSTSFMEQSQLAGPLSFASLIIGYFIGLALSFNKYNA